MTGARSFAFEASADEAGERLDRVCAARLAGETVSRSQLAKLCESGDVTVNDKPARASLKLRAGDRVSVHVPPPPPSTAIAEDLPLTVLYEDSSLIVVDKPAGLVVHPAKGHATGTLVNAVLFHADVEEDDDALRPGIVHRLDKDTSGVLVVAKTAAAREGLMAQFKAHSIERAYVALVVGVPPAEISYDTLHGRHLTDRKKFTTRVKEGRRAVTHVKTLEVLAKGKASLVRCTLETGRTHQIRVHLSEAGFPILADATYGRKPADPGLRKIADELGRQALHAQVLGFVHPVTKQSLRFESAIPKDLQAAINAARELGTRGA